MSNRLSPATLQLWAKSDRGKDNGAWHPLICHLLDVAASCLEILQLEPPRYRSLLAQDFGCSEEQAVALTVALVALHDLGKANGGFQRKSEHCLIRVKEAGFHLPPETEAETPHGIVSQVYLAELLTKKFGIDGKAARLLADAVGAHHGFRTASEILRASTRKFQTRTVPWTQAVDELFDAVWSACGAPPQWNIQSVSAACFQRLMGLTSVADWIGSSLEFAPFDNDPAAYLQRARDRARARLRGLGWSRRSPLRDQANFSEIFAYLAEAGQTFSPRGLQQAVVDLLENVSEPVLLLVEAPMGEGKTEAGFYAHVAIAAAVGHRGAYVGLPSQATGNAMFERLRDFLAGQGRQEPPDLQLLHGAQLLNERYQDLRVASNTGGHDEPNVVAQSYFSHLKRALLSEYGAGTIDQALLGVLGVKHQFVRLWGLGNRTVILDEVHAYDTYTSSLLLALVRWLRALGSSVILMSATLPRRTRQQMLEAFAGRPMDSSELPYPRVAMVGAGQAREATFQTRPLVRFQLLPLEIATDAVADRALDLTSGGGCLVCIANTVDRAQAIYRRLRESREVDEVMLFHARFPIEQKQKIEERVLQLFGKGETSAPNPKRPARAILVATQVVEQSLDLDFDVMLTDLAPIDLVLQRAGRLHRHDKNNGHRGSHEQAALYVCGLSSRSIEDDWGGTYWEKIYRPDVLIETWATLRDRTRIDLSIDLDPLVQAVYDRIEPDQQDQIDQRDAAFAELGNPDTLEWRQPPKRQEDRDENDPQGPLLTRKTQETVTIALLHRSGDSLYLDRDCTMPARVKTALPLEAARAIYARTVKVSRFGVVKTLQRRRNAQPWSKTPILQNVYLLELEQGETVVGSTRLTLDPEIGLYYRKEKTV